MPTSSDANSGCRSANRREFQLAGVLLAGELQANCKVAKTKENRQGRQERQESKNCKLRCFFVSAGIFLGALGVLGGSKKDFAVLLELSPHPLTPVYKKKSGKN